MDERQGSRQSRHYNRKKYSIAKSGYSWGIYMGLIDYNF